MKLQNLLMSYLKDVYNLSYFWLLKALLEVKHACAYEANQLCLRLRFG